MTLDALAERCGEDLTTIERYVDIGVIPNSDCRLADAERVRLVQLLRRRGIDAEAISGALARQLDPFDRYLAQLYPGGDYPSVTLEDAASQAGVNLELAKRVRGAGGLGVVGELLTEADVASMRTISLAMATGFARAWLSRPVVHARGRQKGIDGRPQVIDRRAPLGDA